MQVVGWVPVEDPVRARVARREHRARHWRRLVLRHRRRAAAVALALAAALVVQVLRPPPPPTTAVLVAGRDLPAGHRLADADLAGARVPGHLVPDVAVPAGERAALAGRVLAAPLGRGELVTTTRTVGAGLMASAPARTLGVPVALGTALPQGSVRAGDRVAVLAGADATGYDDPAAGGSVAAGGGQLLVASATVLVAPAGGDPDTGLLGGGSGGAPVAVLALTPQQARDVAGAAGTRPLTLALLPPADGSAN